MKIKTMIAATLVGGLAPVTLPLPYYAAQAGANQCMDRDERLAEIVKTNKPPQSASAIVHTTNVMYVLKEAMDTLDRLCTAEADYSEVRGGYKRSYDQALENCRSLASNVAVCVPTPYSTAQPLARTTARAGANQCMDRDERLAEIVETSKPPQSASTIVHMTNLMYVLKEAMDTLDRLCTAEADYSEVRGGYKRAYDQALENCRALASNVAVCVPTRYVRPY